MYQQTLRRPIQYTGIELYGGNDVQVDVEPAEEDTGILFITPKGQVKASLDAAVPSRSSIALQNSHASVLHIEHFLATLFAYKVDNAIVRLNRIPKRNFKLLQACGLATNVEVIPVSPDREYTLCKKIEESEIEQQKKERRTLNLSNSIKTEHLEFKPANDGLTLRATTIYPKIGEQSVSLRITPETYRDQLSRSRMYAKFMPPWSPYWLADIGASLAYPHFGLSHGFSPETVFLPTQTTEEWKKQEIYPAEIARHAIVDRLGALSLLDGRIDKMEISTKFSGHITDLKTLNQLRCLFKEN